MSNKRRTKRSDILAAVSGLSIILLSLLSSCSASSDETLLKNIIKKYPNGIGLDDGWYHLNYSCVRITKPIDGVHSYYYAYNLLISLTGNFSFTEASGPYLCFSSKLNSYVLDSSLKLDDKTSKRKTLYDGSSYYASFESYDYEYTDSDSEPKLVFSSTSEGGSDFKSSFNAQSCYWGNNKGSPVPDFTEADSFSSYSRKFEGNTVRTDVEQSNIVSRQSSFYFSDDLSLPKVSYVEIHSSDLDDSYITATMEKCEQTEISVPKEYEQEADVNAAHISLN